MMFLISVDRWADCLYEEFFMQADLEKHEGLPIAEIMDRSHFNKQKLQTRYYFAALLLECLISSFISHLLLPLFRLLGRVVPNMEEPYLKCIDESLSHYSNSPSKKSRTSDPNN